MEELLKDIYLATINRVGKKSDSEVLFGRRVNSALVVEWGNFLLYNDPMFTQMIYDYIDTVC